MCTDAFQGRHVFSSAFDSSAIGVYFWTRIMHILRFTYNPPKISVSKFLSRNWSLKVNTTIQPVFARRKTEQDLNVKEAKPLIINEQCVVYNFQCDLCDAGYVHVNNVTHADIYIHKNPPQLPNITRTCMERSLKTCWNILKCLRNGGTNLTV